MLRTPDDFQYMLNTMREADNTVHHGCVITREPELPFTELDLRSQIAVAYETMSKQLKEANYHFEHLTSMMLPDGNNETVETGVPFIPMLFINVEQMDAVILTLHINRGKLMNSIRFCYQNGQNIDFAVTIS